MTGLNSKGLQCDYSLYSLRTSRNTTPQGPELRNLRNYPQAGSWPGSAIQHSTGPPALSIAPQASTQSFPVVFFLDFTIFQRGEVEIPRLSIPLPPYIMEYVRDPRQVAAEYFENIHPWMPVVSKKRFYDHLLNPLLQPRADVMLLIFCMKLIAWSPLEQTNEHKPKTLAYMTVKRCLLEAEVAGIFTVQLLQALLLVTLYELGHGIYPAAYMSVGACARYGLALGVDGQTLSKSHNSTLTLLQQEEDRRVWWACVILDRFDDLSFIPTASQSPYVCFAQTFAMLRTTCTNLRLTDFRAT